MNVVYQYGACHEYTRMNKDSKHPVFHITISNGRCIKLPQISRAWLDIGDFLSHFHHSDKCAYLLWQSQVNLYQE